MSGPVHIIIDDGDGSGAALHSDRNLYDLLERWLEEDETLSPAEKIAAEICGCLLDGNDLEDVGLSL